MKTELKQMMNLNQQLNRALEIAIQVHYRQEDKSGKPYILHPLHLMHQLLYDMELAIIAILHDVVEDSNGGVDISGLIEEGFSKRITDALTLLTHDEKDDYLEDYIPKICSNYDAIRVKRKDLEHNSNITRLKGVRRSDLQRMEKYHRAFMMLTEAKRNFQNKSGKEFVETHNYYV